MDVAGAEEEIGSVMALYKTGSGRDVIDPYYQHRLDPNTPMVDTVDAMAGLVRPAMCAIKATAKRDTGTLMTSTPNFNNEVCVQRGDPRTWPAGVAVKFGGTGR